MLSPLRLGRRRRRCRSYRQAGFTLMEVLVAAGISAGVVVAAYAALTGGLAVYERAGAVTLEVQVVRALTDRLTQELQATYFNPQSADLVFVGEEDVESGGSSRLTFVTAAGAGPLTEVEYFLKEPEPDADEPGGLYRRARLLLDRQVAEVRYEDIGTSEEVEAVLLAPEVVDFRVACYDPEAGAASSGPGSIVSGEEKWETSWDAVAKGYLPGAVRLILDLGTWPEPGTAVGLESQPDDTRRVTLVVMLPLARGPSEAESGAQAGGE